MRREGQDFFGGFEVVNHAGYSLKHSLQKKWVRYCTKPLVKNWTTCYASEYVLDVVEISSKKFFLLEKCTGKTCRTLDNRTNVISLVKPNYTTKIFDDVLYEAGDAYGYSPR
jgi:hypothetical protein